MHLVQLLLPLNDKAGRPYPASLFGGINRALTKQFGGVTAYSRAPAKGQWRNSDHVEHDDVIAVEVMVTDIDRGWWAAFREGLQRDMDQKEIVVRAHPIQRL